MRRDRYIGYALMVVGVLFLAYSLLPQKTFSPAETEANPDFEREYVLKTSILDLPRTFDPNRAISLGHRDFMGLLYDNLLVIRGLSARLTPHLATAWSYDPNANTYELVIRQDVRFWDGSELTAKDVLKSFHGWLAPQALHSSLLAQIKGAAEYGSGKAASVSGLSLAGKYKIKVELQTPDSFFLRKLSSDPFRIFKRTEGRILGTGPFIPERRNTKEIVLKRNDNYFAGAPGLKGFHFFLMAYPEMNKALATKKIDLTWNDFLIPLDFIKTGYKELPNLDYRSLLLYLHTAFPHFDSRDKRLAIFNAIDRPKIVADCNLGQTATTLIPPKHLGFTDRATEIPPAPTEKIKWPDSTGWVNVEDVGQATQCIVKHLNRSFKKVKIPLIARKVSLEKIDALFLSSQLGAAIEFFSFPPDNEIKPFMYFTKNSAVNLIGQNSDVHENLIQLANRADSLEARAAVLRELDYTTRALGYALPLCHSKEIYYIRKDIVVGDNTFFRRTPEWHKIGKVKP